MEQVSSLKTGVKYKDTPIGKIPVDWEVVRLGDVCDVIGGSTPSTKNNEYWGGEIPFATPTDITSLQGREISDTKQSITQEGLSSCGARLLPVGSVLLTSRATLGACAINTKPMATNQGFASLVCNEMAYNWFIYYKMIALQQELDRLGSGSTFKEVSKSSIRSLNFSLPPLPEQKQIADILTTVDEVIEKTSWVIEKTKELKKGLMQSLLTGGIEHNKFKKTEIGEIPEVWTTIKLNDVVKLSSGKPRPKDFIPEYGRDSIYPIYGGNGILGYSSKFNFENKTIILGRVGEYCGVVHRNDGKCWISDNALYIKELKYSFFDLQFLALSLEYKDLNKYKSQSGQPLISQRVLYNLELALPPIDEQKKISAIISEITNMLENEQSHKAELEQIKKGLMQVLLTGKLRVAL